VCTSHTDKFGHSKIRAECKLPLTGKAVIDVIITELAVFECDRRGGGGLTLTEITEGVTLDEVKAKTDAPFKICPNLKYTAR
jgi:acyl CoA:acetate/3-ketoacid CoA transferase beta subunit